MLFGTKAAFLKTTMTRVEPGDDLGDDHSIFNLGY
jgi:hypothetical protein